MVDCLDLVAWFWLIGLDWIGLDLVDWIWLIGFG